MRSHAWILAVAAVASPGCLNQTEAPPIRYFQPPHFDSPENPDRTGMPLLIRVLSSSHLGEPVIWQDDGVEVGFYVDRRWVAPPGRFLEDALRDEFFVVRNFQQLAGGGGAILDVELVAFDEERRPRHAALVRARASFREPGSAVVRSRTATARVELLDDDPVGLARGLAEGLDLVVRELADWIESSVHS